MNIIERIQKLLRLTKSPFAAEAEIAMTKAFELAARHAIDLSSIDLSDDTRRLLHDQMPVGARIPKDRRLALGIVQTYFNVTFVIGYPLATIVGTETDIALARHIVEYLVSACRRCTRSWVNRELLLGRRITPAKRRSYTFGFFYGVASNLKTSSLEFLAERGVTAAVILRDAAAARDQYIGQNFRTRSHQVAIPRFSKSALAAGYQYGRATEIRKPIAPSQRLELSAPSHCSPNQQG